MSIHPFRRHFAPSEVVRPIFYPYWLQERDPSQVREHRGVVICYHALGELLPPINKSPVNNAVPMIPTYDLHIDGRRTHLEQKNYLPERGSQPSRYIWNHLLNLLCLTFIGKLNWYFVQFSSICSLGSFNNFQAFNFAHSIRKFYLENYRLEMRQSLILSK